MSYVSTNERAERLVSTFTYVGHQWVVQIDLFRSRKPNHRQGLPTREYHKAPLR